MPVLFIMFLSFRAAIEKRDDIMDKVERLQVVPKQIEIYNAHKVNNRGGHLQGIQYLNQRQSDYYVLTGSSDSYSYYAVVKSGDEPSVISI